MSHPKHHKSILDSIIEDRLKAVRTAPERLKVLEDLLENGRLKPKQLEAVHEEIVHLRKTLGSRR